MKYRKHEARDDVHCMDEHSWTVWAHDSCIA
jgi:hypothetical protein